MEEVMRDLKKQSTIFRIKYVSVVVLSSLLYCGLYGVSYWVSQNILNNF